MAINHSVNLLNLMPVEKLVYLFSFLKVLQGAKESISNVNTLMALVMNTNITIINENVTLDIIYGNITGFKFK